MLVADIVDRQRRSEMMSRIGPRDTAPELAVRRMAHRMGLRFRVHSKHLPGRPDIVFARHRLVRGSSGPAENPARASGPALDFHSPHRLERTTGAAAITVARPPSLGSGFEFRIYQLDLIGHA
jgi:hypothetical protein